MRTPQAQTRSPAACAAFRDSAVTSSARGAISLARTARAVSMAGSVERRPGEVGRLRFRRGDPNGLDRFRLERGEHDRLHQAPGAHQAQRGRLDAAGLDLQAEGGAPAVAVEKVLQAGDALHAEVVPAVAEAGAGVQAGEGRPVQVGDSPLAVGRAVDGGVVDEDEHAVACRPDVRLNAVDVHRQPRVERGEGVLRRVSGGAAVTDDPERAGHQRFVPAGPGRSPPGSSPPGASGPSPGASASPSSSRRCVLRRRRKSSSSRTTS